MAFRRYLKIRAAEHRTALTRLLLGDHCLAVVRLRHLGVERARRLCRFGDHAVEDELHAFLLGEGSSDLTSRRAAFLDEINQIHASNLTTPLQFMTRMLCSLDTIAMCAKYVYDILRIFDSVPISLISV